MNTSHLQLYHFNSCPYCIRVKLAIKRMGIKIASKNIHANRAFQTELVKGGGKKQVPCLRIEEKGDVSWLYESGDILAYLKKLSSSLNE